MRTPRALVLAACAAVLVVAADGLAAARTQRARSRLQSDARYGLRCTVDFVRKAATRRSPARDTVVLRLARLDPEMTYALWGDDPTDESSSVEWFRPFEVTPTRRRTAVVAYDSLGDDTFPFGATLEQLSGRALQVRDTDGNIVLVGTFPAFPPPTK